MKRSQLEKIAKEYPTPSYVFDVSILQEKIREIREILPTGTGLCFAVKANPFLIPVVSNMVDRLEVCSPGEYEICMREQIPPEKMIVSGVNKTYDAMKHIFSYSKGRGIYTMESERHYDILARCAKEAKTKIKVLLRLSSGNQFGMDEENLLRVAKLVLADANMELVGIHFYSGTQKKSAKVEKELGNLEAFAERFFAETGTSLLELEYGPGLKVSYFENDGSKDVEESNSKQQLCMLSEKLSAIQGYQDVTIEVGRFLASDCGYYLTSIVDRKRTENTGYLIVDGGIHQLNYYGWMMGMKRPYIQQLGEKEAQKKEKWNLCGSLCTVNDVLARDVELDDPEIGDVLVLERCGAYAATEGMAMFLSRELPRVFLYQEDGTIKRVRDKIETNYLIEGEK